MEFGNISRCSFSKKGELVVRSIAGETIIVPVRGRVGDLDAIYNLNEAGGFIWGLIDGQRSVSQIVDAVCGEFEVTAEQAAADVAEFLSAVEGAGLVEASGEKG